LHSLEKKFLQQSFLIQAMFSGLKNRWKVNGWRLLLILITFAVAGSATGYVGRLIMEVLDIDTVWLYILIYVLLVSLIWPFMVIMFSIVFGQFHFFKNYLARMGRRMFGKSKSRQKNPGLTENQVNI